MEMPKKQTCIYIYLNTSTISMKVPEGSNEVFVKNLYMPLL